MPRLPDPVPLAALAEFLGGDFEGDGSALIGGFASLTNAQSDELIFVRDEGMAGLLSGCAAKAVLAPPGVDVGARAAIRRSSPGHDFSRLVERFAPRWRPPVGVAEGAYVDASAEVDPTACVEPGARVGPRCRVGPRSVIGAQVTLVADVQVGCDGWIHPGVVVREDTRIGDRVVLQPGVVIGGDGFGYVPDDEGRPVAMAHRGRVVIEDDVEIGACSTVDRGTLDETRIRRGAKIDNHVQIAHNCDVGEDVLIAAMSGLSGGTVIGARAILMARCATTGHLRIGSGAFLAANTAVHHDVPEGARLYGAPAMEERGWHRTVAALKRLPELLKRVRRLERALNGRAEASDDD